MGVGVAQIPVGPSCQLPAIVVSVVAAQKTLAKSAGALVADSVSVTDAEGSMLKLGPVATLRPQA
jgi:hypothetical protein